jgi:hypothetical protein
MSIKVKVKKYVTAKGKRLVHGYEVTARKRKPKLTDKKRKRK